MNEIHAEWLHAVLGNTITDWVNDLSGLKFSEFT